MLTICLFAIACFFAVWGLSGLVRKRLVSRMILDTPNDRSMHTTPVPRGGGLGIWLGVLPLWVGALIYEGTFMAHAGLLAGALLLIGISWLDDKRSLSSRIRFLAHVIAAVLGLSSFNDTQMVFQGFLPFWADRAFAILAWVWFINLYNFMDGIDGISGAESCHLALGFLCISSLTLSATSPMLLAALLLGAAAGFLMWNWHPAKMFMGDVGSVPLGFLFGYLMIYLAMHGYLGIALVLPLYYVADATLTLLKRMAARKKFWQAHREHFYQQATLTTGKHDKTVKIIIGSNAGLLVISLLSLETGSFLLLLAPLLVAGVLWYLNRLAKSAKN